MIATDKPIKLFVLIINTCNYNKVDKEIRHSRENRSIAISIKFDRQQGKKMYHLSSKESIKYYKLREFGKMERNDSKQQLPHFLIKGKMKAFQIFEKVQGLQNTKFIIFIIMGNDNKSLQTSKKSEQEAQQQVDNQPREVNLKPITFEEFGPQQNTNLKQKTLNKQMLMHTPSRFSHLSTKLPSEQQTLLKSQRKILEINLQTMGVTNANNQIKIPLKQPIYLPFDVVKLTFEKGLLQTIKQCDTQFLYKLENLKTRWYLTAKGYYANYDDDKKIITIIKAGNLYQGEFYESYEDIIPHGKGKLITNQGIFKGQFKDGYAHGVGYYTNKFTKTEYRGVWVKGDLTKGKIVRQDFIYEGRFQKCIADGKGVITFPKQKATYEGTFKDGCYQDENGYFQCDFYAYAGGFKNGRKDGKGCLIEKERNMKCAKKSKSKYHPQIQYQGYFQNDTYIGNKPYALRTQT